MKKLIVFLFLFVTSFDCEKICGQYYNCSEIQIDPAVNVPVTNSSSTRSTKNIKLAFHFISQIDGQIVVDNPIQYINNLIYDLNGIFSESEFNFFYDPCQLSIVNRPDLYNYFSNNNIGNLIFQLPSVTDAVNIYINNGSGGGIADGIPSKKIHVGGIIATQNFNYTVAHEIGHCFGLLHTHHGVGGPTGVGGCEKGIPERPISGNKDSGDFCEDTPADPLLSYKEESGFHVTQQCIYQPNLNFFCGDPTLNYTPLTNNIMSYTRYNCIAEFTDDQIDRMHTFVSEDVIHSNPEIYDDIFDDYISGNLFKKFTGKIFFRGRIFVFNNSTLIFENADVKMMEGAEIVLFKGSRLIINNSTISSCSGKWEGIKMEAGIQPEDFDDVNESTAPYLYIGLSSIISDAKTAISTSLVPETFWWWNWTPCTNCGGLVLIDNSSIVNNEVGVNFRGYNENSKSKISNSSFINNFSGIAMSGLQGLEITNSNFTSNVGNAITGGDSYVKIYNNCIFTSNGKAINLSGTFPGSTGCEIGRTGTAPNIFQGNEEAISIWGGVNPRKNTIVNNIIKGSTYAGTSLWGSNSNLIGNNNYENNAKGIISFANGSEVNDIECNVMDNPINNYVLYNNPFTQVLENDYSTTNSNQLSLYYATIRANQGSQANPAGNCFSHTAPDIFQIGTGQNFNYHFYDPNAAVDCQEPLTQGSYLKNASPIRPENCDGKIGPFQGIDPDGDGVIPPVIIPGDTTILDGDTLIGDPVICWPCIKDSIRYWTDMWLDHDPDGDGDDDDLSEANNEAYYQAYQMQDEWTNYGLALAQESNQYNQAVYLLNDLPGFRWKARLFGIYILGGQFEQAQNVLNEVQPSNTDESNFKATQVINLLRLQSLDPYQATSSHLSTLYNITYSNLPSAGYARSLYYIMTGQYLDINLPELPSGGGPRSREDLMFEPKLHPNPTSNLVFIDFPTFVNNSFLKVYDVQGSLVQTLKLDQTNNVSIDLSNQNQGLYFIKLTYNEHPYVYKVIKN